MRRRAILPSNPVSYCATVAYIDEARTERLFAISAPGNLPHLLGEIGPLRQLADGFSVESLRRAPIAGVRSHAFYYLVGIFEIYLSWPTYHIFRISPWAAPAPFLTLGFPNWYIGRNLYLRQPRKPPSGKLTTPAIIALGAQFGAAYATTQVQPQYSIIPARHFVELDR